MFCDVQKGKTIDFTLIHIRKGNLIFTLKFRVSNEICTGFSRLWRAFRAQSMANSSRISVTCLYIFENSLVLHPRCVAFHPKGDLQLRGKKIDGFDPPSL